MSVIARAPVAPPATSPLDPRFYDERDLESELRRAFQICHECRMCLNYCGSFPDLFKRIDRDIETRGAEGAELIDYDDVKSVSDACWQCKLCYIKCPYTPDEGSKELLDFPRLMAREKAVRAQREGIPLVDQILAEPQLVGQLGSGKAAPIANLISANRLLRKVQEKVTGISAEFPLPPMATETFGDWFEKHTPPEGVGEAGEVVLFSTCYGDFNTPSVPRAAVMVLEHNGYKVFRASEEALCCGIPALDGGDVHLQEVQRGLRDAHDGEVREHEDVLVVVAQRAHGDDEGGRAVVGGRLADRHEQGHDDAALVQAEDDARVVDNGALARVDVEAHALLEVLVEGVGEEREEGASLELHAR
jgi:glycerol-3-phosphate dehydrogenase subunit C